MSVTLAIGDGTMQMKVQNGTIVLPGYTLWRATLVRKTGASNTEESIPKVLARFQKDKPPGRLTGKYSGPNIVVRHTATVDSGALHEYTFVFTKQTLQLLLALERIVDLLV